jgi:phage shock protein PspC (stress-responsive transcriptional regulator)
MSAADEIAKLHALLVKGAITQAEFEQAKARLLAQPAGSMLPINRLRLSDRDKWIAGVCGGIGAATGVESWIWRLVFVLGLLFGGFTLLLYLLLWIFVPREGAKTDAAA